jgi:dicarboxylate transporter 10
VSKCRYHSFYYITYFVYSYKHAIDGLYRVFKEEGFAKMYSGASMASSRAVLVTVGQVVFSGFVL